METHVKMRHVRVEGEGEERRERDAAISGVAGEKPVDGRADDEKVLSVESYIYESSGTWIRTFSL